MTWYVCFGLVRGSPQSIQLDGNLRILILALNFSLKVLQKSNWGKVQELVQRSITDVAIVILLTILFILFVDRVNELLDLFFQLVLQTAWFSKLRGFLLLNIYFVSQGFHQELE